MNIRADKIVTALIIPVTVKHDDCILTVLKVGLAKKMYSQSWFVKEKSFCCPSVVQLHIHWHHNFQQWTMTMPMLTA